MNPTRPHALVFGGSGAIGRTVVARFADEGWLVTAVTRQVSDQPGSLTWNPLEESPGADDAAAGALRERGPVAAVCWAQGENANDSAYDFNARAHISLYQANVLYVLASLHVLLKHDLLSRPARLCVVSSIWQNMSRQNKLSYGVTKAAVQGLVLSAANDLARDGHLVNAVLPGVLDTPMTRRNLKPEQIAAVERSTQFNRLPTLADVANAVYSLCGPGNTGVTGQFINVDLGYSNVRVI